MESKKYAEYLHVYHDITYKCTDKYTFVCSLCLEVKNITKSLILAVW